MNWTSKKTTPSLDSTAKFWVSAVLASWIVLVAQLLFPGGPVGPGTVLAGPVGPGAVLAAPVGPVGPVGPGTVLAGPVGPVTPMLPAKFMSQAAYVPEPPEVSTVRPIALTPSVDVRIPSMNCVGFDCGEILTLEPAV